MKKYLHLLLLTAAIIGGMLSTCQADTLRVASTLDKPLTETILAGYQATTGNTTEVTYITPEAFQDKINSLYRRKFDCVMGPTQESFYMANQQRLLLPYASEQLYTIPQAMQVQKNAWTNVWVDHVAFASNTKKLEKLGIYAPTTWLELLNTNLKEEIALAEYENSQALFAGITSIWQMEGETLARHYAHEWNRQKIKFTRDEDAAIVEVVKGKKALTILPLTWALELKKKYGTIYVSLPIDANRHILTGAAILGNTQQEGLAQRFIDYLLSDEFIAHMQGQRSTKLWHVKQMEDPEQRAMLGNTKMAMDDLGWSALAKKEIIKRWKKA